MKTETYFDVNISVLNYDNLKEWIINDISKNKKSTIIAINPEKIMKARENIEIKKILNEATYKLPDGIGIVYASKIKKGKINSRITGIDCMEMLCSLSHEKGYKIFMYGSTEENALKAKKNLEKKFSNINIVGYMNGYETNNDLIIKKINNVKPDIIFVALGSPKQEYWIKDNLDKIDASIFQGVGGSFDVFSGKIKRAPKWMQLIGLEWLYRLFKQPKRIFRQIKLLEFLIIILFEKYKKTFIILILLIIIILIKVISTI